MTFLIQVHIESNRIHSFSAAALRDPLFDRVTDDNFIQERRFVGPFSQDATQTLNIFLCAGRNAQNDGDFGFGHINTFLQGAAGEQRLELPGPEAIQNGLAFGGFGVVGDRREQMTARQLLALLR